MQKTSIQVALLLFFLNVTFSASQPKLASASNKEQIKLGINTGLSTDGLVGLNENQKVQILKLLDSAKIHVTSIEGKKWNRRRQSYLAIGSDSLKSQDNYQFHLFAFELSGPKIRLMAISDGPYTLGKRETLVGFDFAAYQINPHEYAFGIRYSRVRSYAAGGESSLEGILLYRIEGKAFQGILNMTTSFESELAGEWNEDGTRDRSGNSGHAVIIVTKHKTDGYFDWIKKADDGKSAPLIWDGSSYAMQGEDPFPIHELDIFESE